MEKKTLAYVLVAVALAGFAFVVITNKPSTVTQTEKKNQDEKQANLLVLKKTDHKIVKEEPKTSIEVIYPEYENVPASVNSIIKKFADDEVANILELKLEEIPTSAEANYFLKISYETEQANTDYLSLVFTVSIYTGGAHPNQYFKTYNFDMKTGQEISVANLYPEDVDAFAMLKPKIKQAVNEKLSAFFKLQGDNNTDPNSILFDDIENLGPEYFESFTFSNTYIKFFFSPYDIAPYVVGPIIVQVER